MNNKLLTPRQVMYRLEKFEENEKKLKEYKESIKLELNRLRKVESRYKQHINEHSSFKLKDMKNFKNESILKHHRHHDVFTIPADINKNFVIAYNVKNKQLHEVMINLNIRCCKFKIDDLSCDDVINNSLIVINDNSDIVSEFIKINKTKIKKILKYDNIITLVDLNNLRINICKIIK